VDNTRKTAGIDCRQEFKTDSLFSDLTVAGLGQISAGPDVIFTFSDGGTFGPSMRIHPWRQVSSRISRARSTIALARADFSNQRLEAKLLRDPF
jgi:hypothetical protein